MFLLFIYVVVMQAASPRGGAVFFVGRGGLFLGSRFFVWEWL